MKYFILLLLAALTYAAATPPATEHRIRIAVVDTGIDFNQPDLAAFKCLDGHFTTVGGSPLVDAHGHGTMVARAIVADIDSTKVCLLSAKWFRSEFMHLSNLPKTLEQLTKLNIDFVNISASGYDNHKIEESALQLLSQQAIIVVAAGNYSQDLDKLCNVYPACYKKLKNFFVAGATSTYSNKGSFLHVVNATSTSEAAGIVTNRLLKAYLGKL